MRRARFGLRRAVAFLVALVQVALLAPGMVRPLPALAAGVCSLGPGQDGNGGTLTGTSNNYYYPANGTTLTPGQTVIPLGTLDTTGGGASTPLVANDLLLIIQMQDGTISTSNSSAYGDGATGSGYTSLGQGGLYEYVSVQTVSGTNVTILGANAGGLVNRYVEAAATATQGQRTFQIIRVPQFITATLSSTFRAAYWDGKTGGVAALDIASTLNLGNTTVYATGDGFRGGGLTAAGSEPVSVLNSDWVDSAGMNGTGQPGQGSKGEGVFGTPGNIFQYTNFGTPSAPAGATVTNSTTDGYPGGDMAKGAPGNAGGGGTDMDPAANDQNTGGGGGANGGAGGNGGYPWTPNYSGNTSLYSINSPGQNAASGYAVADATHNPDIGGRGGSSLTPSATRVFMGGGGGAGSNNNSSNNNSYNAYGSSGGVGGGIVMMRIANASNTATIAANGTSGLAPANDGGGGGGAGGTVMITSPATFTGVTVNANGAAGTTAEAAGTTYNIQHGPGGGGGGGTVITSSPVSASVSGGANGTTTTFATSYGATSGTAGQTLSVSASQVVGVQSGAECYTGGSPATLLNGPVNANAATGSYDGSVQPTNNNDFTAKGFFPAGATLGNTGTIPGSYIGTTISQGPTTVDVPNEIFYNNTTGKARVVSITATAPTSPSSWTAQVCGDNAGTITCATGGSLTTVGTPGSTSTGSFSVSKSTTTVTTRYWVRYSAPAGLTAFVRYDAPIYAVDDYAQGPSSNWTHNELYPGYVVLTKSVSIQSSGCSGSPPAGTVCPGGVQVYTIDYRNIIAGGASEPSVAGAFPAMTAGSLVITENGSATWGLSSTGLKEALVAGATCSGTSYGDTNAASTFTGATVGSTSFTDKVGGAAGVLVPTGVSGTNQGTICFRVTVK